MFSGVFSNMKDEGYLELPFRKDTYFSRSRRLKTSSTVISVLSPLRLIPFQSLFPMVEYFISPGTFTYLLRYTTSQNLRNISSGSVGASLVGFFQSSCRYFLYTSRSSEFNLALAGA